MLKILKIFSFLSSDMYLKGELIIKRPFSSRASEMNVTAIPRRKRQQRAACNPITVAGLPNITDMIHYVNRMHLSTGGVFKIHSLQFRKLKVPN